MNPDLDELELQDSIGEMTQLLEKVRDHRAMTKAQLEDLAASFEHVNSCLTASLEEEALQNFSSIVP